MKTSKERFPTPKIVLDWSNSILKKWNRVETQIDAFGTGLQYCLIFHHYHPSKILLSKVFMEPKYPHHFKRNLSIFQESLKNSQLSDLTFDINRVAQKNNRENYQILCKLYKSFEEKFDNFNKENCLTPYRGTYTPMKSNPRALKLNNEMVDKIRQILVLKVTSNKEKVKALKFLLDLDEDSFQTSSAGKELMSDDGYTKLPSLLIYDNN